jgi:hypothetical protein
MVVAEFFARFVQSLSSAHALPNRFLGRRNSFGDSKHFGLVLPWDYHNAIGVAAQNVPGRNARVPDIYGNLCCVQLYAIFSGSHGITLAEDRIAELHAKRSVATGAVYHCAGDPSPVRNFSQNVAPHGCVFAPAVINRHDGTRRDVINEIANRARRLPDWPIEHRERAARQAKARIAGLDVQALAADAEPVQSVAYCGGVEFACALDGCVLGWHEAFLV